MRRAKNVAIRTKSVGDLADAVGHAYGLTGDHLQWATTPQQELATRIAEAVPPPPPPSRVAALGEAVDPFAAPTSRTTVDDPPLAAGSDLALAETELALGLPGRKPEWLLPVIVGLLALVVGGAVTLVVMTR